MDVGVERLVESIDYWGFFFSDFLVFAVCVGK